METFNQQKETNSTKTNTREVGPKNIFKELGVNIWANDIPVEYAENIRKALNDLSNNEQVVFNRDTLVQAYKSLSQLQDGQKTTIDTRMGDKTILAKRVGDGIEIQAHKEF